MARTNDDDGFSLLRRWTVIVLLTLLTFTTVMEVVDSFFFGGRFNTDPAFYTLVGGMITGLFAAEVVAIYKGKGSSGSKNGDKPGD